MIALKEIEKVYSTDKIETVALQSINLNIREGEFISIMGPSGSGKSTLLNIIGLLDPATNGHLSLNGHTIDSYGDKMLATAMHRIPILEQAAPKHKWSGLYETTPDHHPIFGPLGVVDGLFICAGFSGHGLMHAPAAGLITSEIVLDGKGKSLDVSRLYNNRFTGGGRLAVGERNVI